MLRSLHIRNYVLIDSLDVTFPEGLIIITGQTGAGKSILLGAMSLLMGAKADASVISEGADSCVVEAEFDIPEASPVREILAAADMDCGPDGLLIRRVVNASGRSRSFVNDEPVQVGLLSELSAQLIDIHSQHSSLLLTNKAFQLSVLDYFAGNTDRLEACRSAWKELQDVRARLREVSGRLEQLSSEQSYNEARFRKLDEAKLREGELEELEEEQVRLANSAQITEALSSAAALLEPSDDQMISPSAAAKEASRMLEKIAGFLPDAAQLAQRLDSTRIELDDIASDISTLALRSDASPQRLEQVEDRMAQLYDLLRQYGCGTVGELIAKRDELASLLYDSTALVEEKAALEAAEKKAAAELDRCADALHQARAAAAPGLSESIQSSVRSLELEKAVFKVSLTPATLGPSGYDGVSFAFSATGSALQDVSKCASGGEISRIMLCLKALMAKFTSMPTPIFDEIDTGVSGSAADKMGSMICAMGADMQVFAITHLPQVAAKGDAHYLVTKEDSGMAAGRVSSRITKLNAEDRVKEIARMLSGSTITPAAIANARELLGLS